MGVFSAQIHLLQTIFDDVCNAQGPYACKFLVSGHACYSVQSALWNSHICDKRVVEACHAPELARHELYVTFHH